jgi:uncharacterized protein YkwD
VPNVSSKRRTPVFVEPLESRRLLSAAGPTAQEQYVLELINRGRADPTAEAARYHTDLNEGLAPGTISSDAKQPLAFNQALLDSADGHSQWMLQSQLFSHNGANGSTPDQRMAAAGYTLAPPFEWAENIAWQSQVSPTSISTDTLDAIHQNLYVDTPELDRGHRLNLMNPDLKEVGVGVELGPFIGYNAVMQTEDYAYSGSQSFLTGVAYSDTVAADHFYTVGEGLGGITVTAKRNSDGAVFSTTTWGSGGYSLALAPGTYTVTATGAALHGTVTDSNVVIGSQNVEADFTPLPGDTGGTNGSSTPPVAALNRHRYGYTSANGHYFCFTVTYSGSNPLVASSLGNLQVSGPHRFSGQANLDRIFQTQNGGNTLVAIYYVKRPRGSWSAADLGLYAIKLPAHQVQDSLGTMNDAESLGSLRIVLST